jgi:hypothetical protein
MSLKDGERPIHLLKQNNPRKLMRHGHFAEGECEIGLTKSLGAKTIGTSHGQDQRQGIAILMFPYEPRQLFR